MKKSILSTVKYMGVCVFYIIAIIYNTYIFDSSKVFNWVIYSLYIILFLLFLFLDRRFKHKKFYMEGYEDGMRRNFVIEKLKKIMGEDIEKSEIIMRVQCDICLNYSDFKDGQCEYCKSSI